MSRARPASRGRTADRATAGEAAADVAQPVHVPVPATDVPAETPGEADCTGLAFCRPASLPPVPGGAPAGAPGASGPDTAEPAGATDGEALLAMAQVALDTQRTEHPELARRSRCRLVAQIDPLSGWARLQDGELLPPSSLGSVLTTLPGPGGLVRLRPLTGADLTARDLGRTTREPSPSLRELLGAVDGERCRFPGCTRHRKLHAHHVVFWSEGGRTDLDNLTLLCSRHHTLVHQLGFQLVLQAHRRLDVRTADDTPVLHHPAKPCGDPVELDVTGRVSAKSLLSQACDSRMDLGYVVSVLLQQAA